jgi:hypothetical protein
VVKRREGSGLGVVSLVKRRPEGIMVVEAVVKRHPNPGHRWVLRAVLKPECPQEGNRQAERIWSEVRKAYPD